MHTHKSKIRLGKRSLSFNLFFSLHLSLCVSESINPVSVFLPLYATKSFFSFPYSSTNFPILLSYISLFLSLCHMYMHTHKSLKKKPTHTLPNLYKTAWKYHGGNIEPLIPYQRFMRKCMSRRIFLKRREQLWGKCSKCLKFR